MLLLLKPVHNDENNNDIHTYVNPKLTAADTTIILFTYHNSCRRMKIIARMIINYDGENKYNQNNENYYECNDKNDDDDNLFPIL